MSTARAYGGKKVKGLSYDPDAWRTPQKLFDQLNARFGFTVDLFADEANAKCGAFLTVGEDAFTYEWANCFPSGCGFWNPPYSRVEEAIEKALAEWAKGFRSVGLVKADTSTKWFRKHWRQFPEVDFLPRVQFEPPPGYTGKVGSPNMGHVLLVCQ